MTAPLPTLQDSVLDAETLDALVRDWLDHAEVLDVMTKGAPGSRATFAPADLPRAVDALRSGQVRAVQVRYLHGGVEWRDTLLPAPTGTRLVRIQTPPSGGLP